MYNNYTLIIILIKWELAIEMQTRLLTAKNLSMMIEQLIRDQIDGFGEETVENSHVYEGSFKSGKRHGIGEIRFANGDNYIGNFKDGKKHGQGTETLASGEVFEGRFFLIIKMVLATTKIVEANIWANLRIINLLAVVSFMMILVLLLTVFGKMVKWTAVQKSMVF